MKYSEINLNAFYRRLAQAGNTSIIRQSNYSTLKVKDSTFPNFHFLPVLNTSNGQETINTIRIKGKDGYPTVMKTSPLITDKATFEQLETYAQYSKTWSAMTLQPNQINISTTAKAISIRQIFTLSEIQTWCNIVEKGLMGSRSLSRQLFFNLSQQTNVYFFLAYWQNNPVAKR